MADSTSRIGDFTDELEQATGEVVADVKDQVGQAIEQGVQSITGSQLTPQQIQQKHQEDQQELAWNRKIIRRYQDIAASQKKVSDQDKQQQMQKQQLEDEEKKQKKLAEEAKKRVVISPAKKPPLMPGQKAPSVEEELARSKQETGKGHGIGG